MSLPGILTCHLNSRSLWLGEDSNDRVPLIVGGNAYSQPAAVMFYQHVAVIRHRIHGSNKRELTIEWG